jgi:peptide deformylase
MSLDILQIGDPRLRVPVTKVDPEEIPSLQPFIDDLIATMRAANGAGLAAIQVGRGLHVLAVEVNNNPRYPYKPNIPLTVLINAEITLLTPERFSNYEGCLSVPNLRGRVPRCPHIRVCALDRYGAPLDFTAKGLAAGTYQHELDHLDGVLFVDRVEDSRTFCTVDNFRRHHMDAFAREVALLG